MRIVSSGAWSGARTVAIIAQRSGARAVGLETNSPENVRFPDGE
jgi:hypothetical protein